MINSPTLSPDSSHTDHLYLHSPTFTDVTDCPAEIAWFGQPVDLAGQSADVNAADRAPPAVEPLSTRRLNDWVRESAVWSIFFVIAIEILTVAYIVAWSSK
jgi:hypothetical protein